MDAPRIAGRYSLLEQLGAGGMGAVHRARDDASGQIVALKQLSSALAKHKRRTLEALFEREYHTLVRLKHPRIIEVHDYGLTESGPYYTMELLDGSDLQQLAPLPYKDACRHLRDVASSLALIHAHRLVHRDVSARNVRLTRDGRAKLIDFGALTAFGPTREVVGTPPCMAPEILRRMPLDHRTDFFALGAVGYWALTGRHAYPARRFEELTALWQRAPLPPSRLSPEIPAALDALIISLLSLDPLARPSSAAAIIDQLTTLGELPAEEADHGADSYLSSGRMVGREGESAWVQKRVLRALSGKGAEVLLEGPAGSGKTRLLHELGLDAQLRGVVSLKADAEVAPGFFGVAAVLAANLLGACPELARSALGQPQRELIAHLSPELREKLEQAELIKLTFDANERRARFQTALYEWFLAVARERTLMIAVDNLQAADDNSAAFLAALGSEVRNTHLILLVTLRTSDKLAAKAAAQALRKRASRLKLSGLSQAACDELVGSLFGDVANCGRVARLLFEKSAGNPQLVSDLAQFLVKKKVVKYAGGTWVLPYHVSADELPSRGEEILAAKLDALSPSARDLAEALSVHVKPVPIELCLTASGDSGKGASGDSRSGKRDEHALAALDELVAEQILGIETTSYRFAQEALREALLARMPEPARKQKHLRAAEALLAVAGDSLEAQMEGAWHLIHGGEEARGADLLAKTGRAFLKAQGESEGVDHLVEALRTAVEVYERHGRSDYEIARLLFALVPLGYFSKDWRVIHRYGLRALDLGLRLTGLSLAYKLRFVFGRRLALKLGLGVARWRFKRAKKRGLDYELEEAIALLCGIVPSTIGSYTTSLDPPGALRVYEKVKPLALFDRDQFPSLMFAWAHVASYSVNGLPYESCNAFSELTQRFLEPQVRKILGEGHFKLMYGGLVFGHAIVRAYCSSSRALELARETEAQGVRIWAMNADQVRTMYHAFRGEIEEVRRYRARIELFAVQGCSTWQAELFVPAALVNSDILTGDVIAARRSWEQLARRAEEIPSLAAYAGVAHAGYLTLRGALPQAIEVYARVLPEFPLRRRVAWLAVRGYFAQALNAHGEHARAKQLLSEGLRALDPNDDALVMSLESRRQLALAELGLGDRAAAARSLDALLAQHGSIDNPLLVGLLHKARAEVALAVRDEATFETHFERMGRRFRSTSNPALIAQWERLSQAAAHAGIGAAAAVAQRNPLARNSYGVSGQRSLADLSDAPDRAEFALWLVVERTRARSGYLYLWEGERWHLAAASSPAEPPPGLETQLRERCTLSVTDERYALSLTDEPGDSEDQTALEPIAKVGAQNDAAPGIVVSADDAAHVLRAPDAEDAFETVLERASLESLPARGSFASLEPGAANRTVFIQSEPAPDAPSYRVIVLSSSREGARAIVGGLILEVSPEEARQLDPDMLETIAASLHERYATALSVGQQ